MTKRTNHRSFGSVSLRWFWPELWRVVRQTVSRWTHWRCIHIWFDAVVPQRSTQNMRDWGTVPEQQWIEISRGVLNHDTAQLLENLGTPNVRIWGRSRLFGQLDPLRLCIEKQERFKRRPHHQQEGLQCKPGGNQNICQWTRHGSPSRQFAEWWGHDGSLGFSTWVEYPRALPRLHGL